MYIYSYQPCLHKKSKIEQQTKCNLTGKKGEFNSVQTTKTPNLLVIVCLQCLSIHCNTFMQLWKESLS